MLQARTIINADDFGWDTDATEAIIQLARLGCISSTTIMANLVNPDDLDRIMENPAISTGIHLNLIAGKPLSDPEQIYSIVNPEDGAFFTSSILWKKVVLGQVQPKHIVSEIEAQICFLRDCGISISHADSHQHLHIYPGLSGIILPVLKKNGISKIRNCNIAEYFDKRRLILKAFCLLSQNHLKSFRYNEVLISAFSIYKSINLDLFHQKVIPIMKAKSLSELMVHPALQNKENSYLQRKNEYDFLKSSEWKNMLLENNIRLISWNEV